MSLTAEAAPSASWWPELLAIKDMHTYAALSERFGVPMHTLRRALELAGETKVSMPRGPKPRVAQRTVPELRGGDTTNPLDRISSRIGHIPDGLAAQMVGVTVNDVKKYRRERAIPPFLREPPGAGTPPYVVQARARPELVVAAGVIPRAFSIVALRGDEPHRFVSLGADMTDALANAVAALSARADGPWRMRSIRESVELLVAPK